MTLNSNSLFLLKDSKSMYSWLSGFTSLPVEWSRNLETRTRKQASVDNEGESLIPNLTKWQKWAISKTAQHNVGQTKPVFSLYLVLHLTYSNWCMSVEWMLREEIHLGFSVWSFSWGFIPFSIMIHIQANPREANVKMHKWWILKLMGSYFHW